MRPKLRLYRYLVLMSISVKLTLLVILRPILHGSAWNVAVAFIGFFVLLQLGVLIYGARKEAKSRLMR